MSQGHDEMAQVAKRYARRSGPERYSMLQPDVWQLVQERQRAILQGLVRHGRRDLAAYRLVEVGCGAGGNLLDFVRMGFAPHHLAGCELLPERIPNAYYGLQWADSQHLFYTQLGEAHRPESVWRHRLGDDPKADQRVLYEPDLRYFAGVEKTASGAFVLLTLDSNTTSEIWFVPAAAPYSAPQVLAPRRQGHEYSADERGGWF